MNTTDYQRPADSTAAHGSAICVCGCHYFVWWIDYQRKYSSETWHEYFDSEKHPDPRCLRCNKKWLNSESSGRRPQEALANPKPEAQTDGALGRPL